MERNPKIRFIDTKGRCSSSGAHLLILNVIIFLALFQFSCQESKPAAFDAKKANVENIKKWMIDYHIPGISVVGFTADTFDFEFHYGLKNVQKPDSVNSETIFEAASLNKPVFAYVVHCLARQQKINLTEPLWNVLGKTNGNYKISSTERYRDLNIYTTFSEDYPEKYFQIIQPIHLLSHSSGLQNWWDEKPTIAFEPGSKFYYSDDAYILLQRHVEYLTGYPINPFEDYYTSNLMQLSNTYYLWNDQITNYASGHDKQGNYKREIWKAKESLVHGTMLCSAKDYAVFMRQFFNMAKVDGSQKTMLEPQVKIQNKENLYWTAGWGLEENAAGKLYWQWGNDVHYQHLAIFNASTNKGFVYMSNAENGLQLTPGLMEMMLSIKHSEIARQVLDK